MDSNACRAREVERKVSRDNDSLLRGLLLKTPQLVVGRFRCVNPVKARGSGRMRPGRLRSIVLRCQRRGFPGGGWCDEAVTGVMASRS